MALGPQEPEIGETSPDPEKYFRWFNPISTPNYPSSKAKAFEGAEKATEGFKEIDEGAKKYLGNDAENRADTLAKTHLSELSDVYDTVFPGSTTKSDLSAGGATLTPSSDTDSLPSELKSSFDKVSNLKAAKDQGGIPAHLRDLDFKVKSYLELQRTRNEFGPYRDVADKKFAEILGFTPTANEVRKTMLADINEMMSKKNTATDKVLNEMISKGYELPGFDQTIKNVVEGKQDVWSAYHEFNLGMSHKYSAEVAKSRMAVLEADDKMRERLAADYMIPTANNYAYNKINGILAGHGLNQKKIAEYAKIVTEGGRVRPDGTREYVDPKTLIPDEKWGQMGTEFQIAMATGEADLNNKFNKPVPMVDENGKPTGKFYPFTYAQAAGKHTKDYLDGYRTAFNNQLNAIKLQDVGLMHSTKRDMEALQTRSEFTALRDPGKLGQVLRGIDTLRKFGGEQWAQYDPGFVRNVLGAHLPSLMAIEGLVVNDEKEGGFDFTKKMSSVLDVVAKETKEDPSSMKWITTAPTNIVNSDSATDAEKIKAITHATQSDDDWLKKIAVENGQDVKSGRFDTFDAYTSQKFIDNMKILNQRAPSQHLMQRYYDWVERNFAVNLYAGEMEKLKGLPKEAGANVSWITPKDKNLPPKVYLQREYAPGAGGMQYRDRYDPTQLHIENLNKGIAAMYRVFGPGTEGKIKMLLGRDVEMSGNKSIGGDIYRSIKSRPVIENSTKNQGRAE